MAEMKKIAAALATAGLLASGAAQATLFDRGGGMIYDSDLNITWLANANQGAGSAWDNGVSTTDGRMTWANAVAWADTLVYGGYSDWRLPTTTDLGAAGPQCTYSGTDCGYNVATNSSELAHLFHVELGNLSAYNTSGTYRGGVGGVDWGVVNTGPFVNLQSYLYWSGTAYAPSPADYAWGFGTYNGNQSVYGQVGEFYAWAVRPGDVAAVPEPASGMLVGLALAGLAALRRRRPLGAS